MVAASGPPASRAAGLGRLLLVRHGQARVDAGLTAGYDRLSELGWKQAEILARHWLACGEVFARVYVGPLRRQRETAEAVGRVFTDAGVEWPAPVVVDDLAEHRGTHAFAELLPRMAARDDELGRLARELEASGGGVGAPYLKLYRHAARRWARGEMPEADALFESWPSFRRRIEAAVAAMVDGAPRERPLAAFTSGGPVAAAAAATLGLGDEATLELSWVVQNCSASELLYSPSRLTLKSFNDHSVLAAVRMSTFI